MQEIKWSGTRDTSFNSGNKKVWNMGQKFYCRKEKGLEYGAQLLIQKIKSSGTRGKSLMQKITRSGTQDISFNAENKKVWNMGHKF